MDRALLINGLTFLLIDLIIYWKLSDPRPFAEKIKYHKSKKAIVVGVFASLFILLNYLSGVYSPLPYSGFDELLTLLGLLIFLSGIALSVWAKSTMGKNWGIPEDHNKSRQSKLVKNGPFKYSRNPIYVGLSLVLIGYGLALQSWFTFLSLIPIFYFYKSAEKEEALLEKHFKEEYALYKKEVPRFF